MNFSFKIVKMASLDPKKTDKKCVNCEAKFPTYSELIEHLVEIHEAHFEFKCSQCEFVSNLPRLLKIHRKTVHEKGEEANENVENQQPNIKMEAVAQP